MAKHRRLSALAIPLTGILTLAACGSSKTAATTTSATAGSSTTAAPSTTAASTNTTAAASTTSAAAPTTAAPSGPTDLAMVCPGTVVIQKDWWAEAEHGGLYQLLPADATIDANHKKITGELTAHGGKDTGVKLEVREGGGAVGFQQDTALLYAGSSILLAYIGTDEAIQNSKDMPTVAVMAPLFKNPQVIFWDPATYPTVKTIADLGKTNAKIQYFAGGTYMDYLIGKGIVKKKNTDGSYNGSPDNFVAAQGKIASQGFGSAEPYIYKNEVKQWGKDVAYQYIYDTGWQPYSQTLATTPDNIKTRADCFKKLVPIIQQAQVDYMADPTGANALLLKQSAAEQNSSGFPYSAGVAAYASQIMLKDHLVANGPDGTLGSFDTARVDALIALAAPIFAAQGKPIKAGLKATDIVTNQFIDPSIKLPA